MSDEPVRHQHQIKVQWVPAHWDGEQPPEIHLFHLVDETALRYAPDPKAMFDVVWKVIGAQLWSETEGLR